MLENFNVSKKCALKLDAEDALKKYRQQFFIPPKTIYLNGNSLGLMCSCSEKKIRTVVDQWKKLAIRGWWEAETPWLFYAEKVGAMAAELVGASPDEVIATGSTTINIHSLISTFYAPSNKRKKILSDKLNFPTDIYALFGQLKLRGLEPNENLILIPPKDEEILNEKEIIKNMTEDVAIAFLPSVLYRSGQLLDMETLTKEAHKKRIIIGFDCSHSVGVIPHYFDKWGLDFAVWCSYKYINGGPGAPAFLYINRKHFDREPLLIGWFGYKKEKQFDMRLEFEHQKSAGGWQISSPGIIGLASVAGALELLLDAGIDKIRAKSVKMTSYLIYLIDEILIKNRTGFRICTPREENKRGGHIALQHSKAKQLCNLLERNNVITDFRPPNIIRIAPVPLYNTYHEIWQAITILNRITKENF